MGDSGSQVLGFALASLGLAASWNVAGSTVATLLLPILVLAVPILDTTLVTVVRILEGRPVTRGGRDHTSHRLVYQGLSDKRAVVLLCVVSAALGLTSLAYRVLDDTLITLIGVLITFAFLLQFGSYLADVNHAPLEDRAPSFARSLLVHRRRLVEVLVDFALICASFVAAYLIARQGPRDDLAAPRLPPRAAGGAGRAIHRLHRVRPLPRGVALRRRAGRRRPSSPPASSPTRPRSSFIWATRAVRRVPERACSSSTCCICTMLVGAARFWERGVARGLSTLVGRGTQRRDLIVGAGRSGRSLLRELRETPGERVIGFVDDDPELRRRRIQGVQVIGAIDEIGWAIGRLEPDAVLVTIPEAPRERLDAVVEACSRAGVPCRFVRREIDLDPGAVLGAAAE